MASVLQGGPGIGLPTTYPLWGLNESSAFTLPTGPIALAPGERYVIPAGQWMITPGSYCFVQYLDPVLGLWRVASQNPNVTRYINSDGANFRVVNFTGCALGAYVTNVGSGYTSAPTVTASAGASTWTAIVGGAINTTPTVVTGGTYAYAPVVQFSAPPAGGLQATGYATLSGTSVSTITMVDQGAGYTTAPTVTFIRDPRDTGNSTDATATTALTGSGTITAVVGTNHGTALTSVPTLSFSGGGGASAAATVVMCFAATGFTVGTAGVAYGTSKPFGVLTVGGVVSGAAGAVVNPALSTGLLRPRMANISGTTTGGARPRRLVRWSMTAACSNRFRAALWLPVATPFRPLRRLSPSPWAA